MLHRCATTEKIWLRMLPVRSLWNTCSPRQDTWLLFCFVIEEKKITRDIEEIIPTVMKNWHTFNKHF